MTATSKSSQHSGLPVGSAIPDMKLANWNGQDIRLRDCLTRRIYFFVSVYCSHCIDLLPHLAAIREKYAYPIFLFSTGDTEDHREMSDYFGWDFPILHMQQSDMEHFFGIEYMPFAFLVDETHTVRAKGVVYHLDDFASFIENAPI